MSLRRRQQGVFVNISHSMAKKINEIAELEDITPNMLIRKFVRSYLSKEQNVDFGDYAGILRKKTRIKKRPENYKTIVLDHSYYDKIRLSIYAKLVSKTRSEVITDAIKKHVEYLIDSGEADAAYQLYVERQSKNKSNGRCRTPIYLSLEEHEALKYVALSKRMNIASYITYNIDEFMDNMPLSDMDIKNGLKKITFNIHNSERALIKSCAQRNNETLGSFAKRAIFEGLMNYKQDGNN